MLRKSALTAISTLTIMSTAVIPALAATSQAKNTATMQNSEVTLTKSEIAANLAHQKQILERLGSLKNTQSSSSISPTTVPGGGGIPSSGVVDTGTTTESDDGTTCGPISAWNLLYHFDGSSTPSLTTLESQSQLGWTQSQGTPFGENWSTTLNEDQSQVTYWTLSNPSVSDVFADTANDVSSSMPLIYDIYGYLPGYQNSGPNILYHYVTGRTYSGYGTNNSAEETIGWYDESDLNANGHYITNTVSTLDSLVGSGDPSQNWLGLVY